MKYKELWETGRGIVGWGLSEPVFFLMVRERFGPFLKKPGREISSININVKTDSVTKDCRYKWSKYLKVKAFCQKSLSDFTSLHKRRYFLIYLSTFIGQCRIIMFSKCIII